MSAFGKYAMFGPLGQAMISIVILLMFVVRWFFIGGILGEFNWDFVFLPLLVIGLGALLYSRFRKRVKQRSREINIQVAIIIDELKRGRVSEEEVSVNEVYLDDETSGYPQASFSYQRQDLTVSDTEFGGI
jgi:hypothetical protein